MIDLRGKLDVFLITNGRSSFPYALAHLESQEGVEFDLQIVRNLPHLKAYKACQQRGEAPFYLRVDDDMFLHPRAVAYFNHLATDLGKNTIMAYARLWEPWGRDDRGRTIYVIDSVKMYQRSLAAKTGFRVNASGRVDKLFKQDSQKKGFAYEGHKCSVVGIHAACSIEENERYAKLRGEKRELREKNRLHFDNVYRKMPFTEQAKKAGADLVELNRRKSRPQRIASMLPYPWKSDFYQFLKGDDGG